MALDSEAIWAALFDRLSEKCPSFKRVSRQRKAQWGVEEYPVLLVLDDNSDETPSTDADAPQPFWTLTGELGILARPVEGSTPPTVELNRLVKEVREGLERAATDPLGTGAFYGRGHVQHYTNLGGLVRSLSVTKVEKGAGELGGQPFARFTLELTAL